MRALMLDPPVLLLDEPLGALDPIIRSDLQQELKELFARLNKTVLLVTHDLNEAGRLASHLVLMDQGCIVQDGSLQDLIQHPATRYVERFVAAWQAMSPAERVCHAPEQLCERWQIAERTLRDWNKRRVVPFFKLGGKFIRYALKDVEAYELRGWRAPRAGRQRAVRQEEVVV
jgi:ABC-type proline/glycine betaine transport system ATPase subunit